MKVPPKRKGNPFNMRGFEVALQPSMKVPPKRKGNDVLEHVLYLEPALNESPSEKEGKYRIEHHQ